MLSATEDRALYAFTRAELVELNDRRRMAEHLRERRAYDAARMNIQ